MSFPFNTEGRIVIPISSPERARDVAAGVECWLEKGRVRDRHWQDNILHFTGDHMFQWHRLICSRPTSFDGMGRCSLKFDDHPTKVVIEYALTFRFVLPLVFALAAVPMLVISGGLDLFSSLIFVPIITLVYGLLWFWGAFDFKSSLRIAATRGMADAAERELQALQPL